VADGEDVLDHDRGGICPLCGAELSPPEYRYDSAGVRYLDGPGDYWCPVCGYSDDEDAQSVTGG
jgi:rubredoxin